MELQISDSHDLSNQLALSHDPNTFKTLVISCKFLRYCLVIALTITYPAPNHNGLIFLESFLIKNLFCS